MFSNLDSFITSLGAPFTYTCYAAGIILAIMGFSRIGNYREHQHGLGGAITSLVVATVLINIPYFVSLSAGTLGISSGSTSPMAYTALSGGSGSTAGAMDLINLAYHLISASGWFAIARGIFMVYHNAHGGGGGDSGIFKAIMFIAFGTLAANIVASLSMIQGTFGITFPGI